MEIERKFIMKQIPKDISVISKKDISQSYISFNPEVRVRKLGNKFFLTEKDNGDLIRKEIEKEISMNDYITLKKRSKGDIEKQRLFINLGKTLIGELDIYRNNLKGLMVIEVEFDSVQCAENFIPPIWFGEEITYDKRFKNKNLARLNQSDLSKLI